MCNSGGDFCSWMQASSCKTHSLAWWLSPAACGIPQRGQCLDAGSPLVPVRCAPPALPACPSARAMAACLPGGSVPHPLRLSWLRL